MTNIILTLNTSIPSSTHLVVCIYQFEVTGCNSFRTIYCSHFPIEQAKLRNLKNRSRSTYWHHLNILRWAKSPLMLHTKPLSWEKIFEEFYHIWVWRQSWSCDPNASNILAFPHTIEAHWKFGFDWPCLIIVNYRHWNMGILKARFRWAKNHKVSSKKQHWQYSSILENFHTIKLTKA